MTSLTCMAIFRHHLHVTIFRLLGGKKKRKYTDFECYGNILGKKSFLITGNRYFF